MLLEFAMRVRVFDERLKNNPDYKWENIEKLKMRALIGQLKKMEIISNKEKEVLDDFNNKFRNPYLHINLHKMIRGIYASDVKKVNINTNEVSTENHVDISKHRHLWFLAKQFYDKSYVLHVLNFCVDWTNKLMRKTKDED